MQKSNIYWHGLIITLTPSPNLHLSNLMNVVFVLIRAYSYISGISYYRHSIQKRQLFWDICFCLFDWSFSDHARIFFSFGDVTMAGEELQILTNFWHLCRMFHLYGDVTLAGEILQILTLAQDSWSIEQCGFFCVQHPLWHGASVYYGHLQGPVTLT